MGLDLEQIALPKQIGLLTLGLSSYIYTSANTCIRTCISSSRDPDYSVTIDNGCALQILLWYVIAQQGNVQRDEITWPEVSAGGHATHTD